MEDLEKTQIFTFWYNPKLNNILDECSRMSILSMLQCENTEVTIYTYGELNEIDELLALGLKVDDANKFLKYEDYFVADYGPLHGFSFCSNIIRYKMLQTMKGWWLDTDIIVAKDFQELVKPETSVAFAYERQKSNGTLQYNGALLYSDGSGHQFWQDALDYANYVVETKNGYGTWGVIGPHLISSLQLKYQDDSSVQVLSKNVVYFNQYLQNDLARWVYNSLHIDDAIILYYLYTNNQLYMTHLWFSAIDWDNVHPYSFYALLFEHTKSNTLDKFFENILTFISPE